MEIKIKELTENTEVLNACRMTVWKDNVDKEPSETFMKKLYRSEHSPIRDKWFVIEIYGIKSWIATHFVRHHVGATPYVSTQRDDRIDYTGTRDERGQGELVNMRLTINAQSIIDVSQRRLCLMAHKETLAVWMKVIKQLEVLDPLLTKACVPSCVYRGFCPEGKNDCLISTSVGLRQRGEYVAYMTSF